MGDRKCEQPGCINNHLARGMCNLHYRRFHRSGTFHHAKDETALQRLYRLTPIRPSNACWVWRGRLNDGGYGTLGFAGKHYLAHRLSYQEHIGELTPNLAVHHKCHNRKCINPEHLIEVTKAVNNIEALAYKADHSSCDAYSRRRITSRGRKRQSKFSFRSPLFHGGI